MNAGWMEKITFLDFVSFQICFNGQGENAKLTCRKCVNFMEVNKKNHFHIWIFPWEINFHLINQIEQKKKNIDFPLRICFCIVIDAIVNKMGSVMPAHAQWECKIERNKKRSTRITHKSGVWAVGTSTSHKHTHPWQKESFHWNYISRSTAIDLREQVYWIEHASWIFRFSAIVVSDKALCAVRLYYIVVSFIHTQHTYSVHIVVYILRNIYWEFSLVVWGAITTHYFHF